MTYFEKLKKDCPGLSEVGVRKITRHMCPHAFYRNPTPRCSPFAGRPRDAGETCRECWNETIPEEKKEDI